MQRFKSRAKDWPSIEKFVHAHRIKTPVPMTLVPKARELEWDAEKLLQHLFVTAQRLQSLKGAEKQIVLLGLKYLISEASKPKIRRDRAWIGQAWSTLHPLLERENLLAPFKKEAMVRERLRSFVRGNQ